MTCTSGPSGNLGEPQIRSILEDPCFILGIGKPTCHVIGLNFEFTTNCLLGKVDQIDSNSISSDKNGYDIRGYYMLLADAGSKIAMEEEREREKAHIKTNTLYGWHSNLRNERKADTLCYLSRILRFCVYPWGCYRTNLSEDARRNALYLMGLNSWFPGQFLHHSGEKLTSFSGHPKLGKLLIFRLFHSMVLLVVEETCG